MRVEVLYPEVASLYGELANVEYLRRSCPGCEVVETSLNERPRFLEGERVDLVYLGTMTERMQRVVVGRLLPLRTELAAAVEGGQWLLATGNALEVFGSRIDDRQTGTEECLGLFPYHAERDMQAKRFNSLYVGRYEDIDVVGFKSQFTQGYYDGEPRPLFETTRGPGFHPDIREEGYRDHNFMATYLIGPLFVLNPLFMVRLVAEMGCGSIEPAFREAALAAYEKRLAEYEEPGRGFYY